MIHPIGVILYPGAHPAPYCWGCGDLSPVRGGDKGEKGGEAEGKDGACYRRRCPKKLLYYYYRHTPFFLPGFRPSPFLSFLNSLPPLLLGAPE